MIHSVGIITTTQNSRWTNEETSKLMHLVESGKDWKFITNDLSCSLISCKRKFKSSDQTSSSFLPRKLSPSSVIDLTKSSDQTSSSVLPRKLTYETSIKSSSSSTTKKEKTFTKRLKKEQK